MSKLGPWDPGSREEKVMELSLASSYLNRLVEQLYAAEMGQSSGLGEGVCEEDLIVLVGVHLVKVRKALDEVRKSRSTKRP